VSAASRVYVDTSVLAAYYCPEQLSAVVEARLTDGSVLVLSRLVQAELASTIARKVRVSEMNANDARSALQVHDRQVDAGVFDLVTLRDADLRDATLWMRQMDTSLRTLDGLHLAIAGRERLVLLTADVRFAVAAKSLGQPVELLGTDSISDSRY